MQTILVTAAPLQLVISDDVLQQDLSIALRIAHDLNKFHKLDSEIIRSSEAMQRATNNDLSPGNIVVIGDPQSSFSHWSFKRYASAFDVSTTPPQLNGRPLDNPSQGMPDLEYIVIFIDGYWQELCSYINTLYTTRQICCFY
jgi:hypothetical protein